MTTVRDALGAVLLFHGHIGPWDEATRESWRALTGVDEATTRVLCDAVRAALATLDAEVAPAPAIEPSLDPYQDRQVTLVRAAARVADALATREGKPLERSVAELLVLLVLHLADR